MGTHLVERSHIPLRSPQRRCPHRQIHCAQQPTLNKSWTRAKLLHYLPRVDREGNQVTVGFEL